MGVGKWIFYVVGTIVGITVCVVLVVLLIMFINSDFLTERPGVKLLNFIYIFLFDIFLID